MSANFAHIIAYSIVESDTMAGGYRIAIELIRKWSTLTNMIFHIHTTIEGKKMFMRYIPPRENIVYDVVWSPEFLRKLCINHALISIILYILLFPIGSVKAFVESIKKPPALVYSVTPFLPDFIPGLLLKLKTRSSKWFVSHAMFSPNPLQGGFGVPSEHKVPSLRDLGFYFNEKMSYPLIKKYADLVSETNALDRNRCIQEGFSPSRVIVIQGGVDTKLSMAVPEPPRKEFDAVFIGRLHPQKGLLELIDIWRIVTGKRVGAKLAIIGNGPLEKEIKEKIRKYGLESNVVLFGFKDGVEKVKIFKNSRIVVHPAVYDSGGMAACEAMSCGLPGVSFDLPALRTYYPKGMLKTPCFDFEAFADAILKLVEDQKFCQNIAEDALCLARSWDWAEVSAKVLDKLL